MSVTTEKAGHAKRVQDVASAVERRSDAWQRIGDFLRANPDIAGHATVYDKDVLISLTYTDAPRVLLVDYVGRGVVAGGRPKEYRDSAFAGFRLIFDEDRRTGAEISIQVYAKVKQVCDQDADGAWHLAVDLPVSVSDVKDGGQGNA